MTPSRKRRSPGTQPQTREKPQRVKQTSVMSRRILAIVNPASGRANTMPLVRRIGRIVETRGACFNWTSTAGAGHATTLASQLDAEVDALLIVGGDGTVSEVVNGLVGKNIPCAILPTGTENLLARALETPRNVDRIAETLLYGQPFSFDMGEINGRRFLAVAGIGFDAECVLRMEKIRSGHITHLDHFWPIWRTFWSHRFPTLHVEADGADVFEDRGFVLIGNVRRYSAGFHVHANARYDDGLLDVCAFPCSSRWELTKHAWRVLRRWHIGRSGVVYGQYRHIRITSPDSVPIEADGESAGMLPAECTVLPGAAKFLRLHPE